MALSFTSDEVNYLVYRYLQESGFQHAAFTLSHESLVHKGNIKGSEVPPGALIALLHKGLQYVGVEWHVRDDGTELDCQDTPGLLTALQPHRCEAMETDDNVDMSDPPAEFADTDVMTLEGHQSAVYACAWNPTKPDMLATTGGDSSARLWSVPTDASQAAAASKAAASLSHSPCEDVAALRWNPRGTLLGTGDGSGTIRLWNESGSLERTLSRHRGVLFALKWSRSGDVLLSGSMDKTAIAWDAATGEARHVVESHAAPVYDVDWRDNASFATCSGDKTVQYHRLGEAKPLRVFRGHRGEVNAIEWDPSGSLLASGSDDWTVRMWNPSADQCVAELREHQERIYRVKWSPTGATTNNPNAKLVLATGAFDATIRLWDPETARCLHTLARHRQSISALCFSPDGQFIASGSTDRAMNVWSVRDGTLVRTLRTAGAIFDINWNAANRIAISLSNKSVSVVDFRQ